MFSFIFHKMFYNEDYKCKEQLRVDKIDQYFQTGYMYTWKYIVTFLWNIQKMIYFKGYTDPQLRLACDQMYTCWIAILSLVHPIYDWGKLD